MASVTVCPKCGEPKLRTRTSKKFSTGTIEARRECTCPECNYADVVLLRPATIIKLRVVGTTKGHQKRT